MKLSNFCTLLIGIGIIVQPTEAQVNYCNTKRCPQGYIHIGCNNTEKFSKNCKATAAVVPLTNSMVSTILHAHNRVRSLTATAELHPHLLPAARLATMQWDCDLAALAHASILRCTKNPDNCRATNAYPYSGQVTHKISFDTCKFIVPNVEELIVRQINSWASAGQNANIDVIDSYVKAISPDVAYGTFTTIVQEQNTHVGCAILRQLQLGYMQQFLFCNYAYQSILGVPVYNVSSVPGSGCWQRSNVYRGLCAINEKYDVKKIYRAEVIVPVSEW